MNKTVTIAKVRVTEADLASARVGQRFARLDLASRLALLAVEKLGVDFEKFPPGHVAVCLAAKTGSLSTDLEFWNGRNGIGGPSPTLFAYTLPSAAVGEIAIRHGLTGPNLCFIGDDEILLAEATDLIHRGEADGCICVCCEVVSVESAKIISLPPSASATAIFLQRDEEK